MNNILCWVDVPVCQLDRAIEFYSAVLGERVTKQKAGDDEFGLFPHVQDGVSGCLVVMESSAPGQTGPLVYFSVAGRLDDAIGAVGRQGGKVLREKHPIGPHGYRAMVLDSEGNRIALHSPTA